MYHNSCIDPKEGIELVLRVLTSIDYDKHLKSLNIDPEDQKNNVPTAYAANKRDYENQRIDDSRAEVKRINYKGDDKEILDILEKIDLILNH